MSTNGEVEFDGDLWFFTYGSSHKVYEVQKEPQVNVGFSSTKDQQYVSMSGTARLVRDRQKIEELWKPQLKAWFPKGTDEPDIALLHVSASKAEYWDSPASVVAHAIGLVKAFATGTAYDGGENKKIEL
ncbi:MAG: pyridoxamine 5'-phosphate oxidase family protein [Pyrinomonadaceae bacterium]